MIKYIIGDALNTDCDILCHQVNLQGVMGGGIAKQIAQRFPNVESEYVNFEKKLANACFAKAFWARRITLRLIPVCKK